MDRYWLTFYGRRPTTIAGRITATGGVVVVADPAVFGEAPFAAVVFDYPTDSYLDPDLEIVTVEAKSNNALTVTRGVGGTAAGHPAGACMMQLPADWDLEETIAAIGAPGLPAGGTAGQVLAKAASGDGLTEWHTLTAGDVGAAPSANGVTNGDSHDHAGGDGAAIPLAGMANMATASLLGRTTALAGAPEVVSAAAARTLLNVADGANAYVHPNHSGDVTSVADGAQTIVAGAVTLAKQANLAANSIIGNNTGSPAAPIALTVAQSRTLLGLGTAALTAATDYPSILAGSALASAMLKDAFLRLVADKTKIICCCPFTEATGTTVYDTWSSAHHATLAADAATYAPNYGSAGMHRSLTFPGSGAEISWGDDAAFTPATGFTAIVLCKPSSVTSRSLLSKYSIYSASVATEWLWWHDPSGYLKATLYNSTGAANYIQSYRASSGSGDTAAPHLYIMTWNGGTAAADIALYRDGLRVDNATASAGTFTGLTNTATPLACYGRDASNNVVYPFAGEMFFDALVAEVWTAAQCREFAGMALGVVGRIPNTI